jgi:hypothetical protein
MIREVRRAGIRRACAAAGTKKPRRWDRTGPGKGRSAFAKAAYQVSRAVTKKAGNGVRDTGDKTAEGPSCPAKEKPRSPVERGAGAGSLSGGISLAFGRDRLTTARRARARAAARHGSRAGRHPRPSSGARAQRASKEGRPPHHDGELFRLPTSGADSQKRKPGTSRVGAPGFPARSSSVSSERSIGVEEEHTRDRCHGVPNPGPREWFPPPAAFRRQPVSSQQQSLQASRSAQKRPS